MDSLSSCFTGSHCKDNGSCSCYGISTGIYLCLRSATLALGRSLAEVEKKFVDKWQNQWQMDLGVITEACDRTVLKLHHADFKYTDGILGRWHKEGVHTMQDVEHSDAEYVRQQDNQPPKVHGNKGRNQFQNFNQRDVSSEDLNELERKLLMQ